VGVSLRVFFGWSGLGGFFAGASFWVVRAGSGSAVLVARSGLRPGLAGVGQAPSWADGVGGPVLGASQKRAPESPVTAPPFDLIHSSSGYGFMAPEGASSLPPVPSYQPRWRCGGKRPLVPGGPCPVSPE
jgi:hypothetical protein